MIAHVGQRVIAERIGKTDELALICAMDSPRRGCRRVW